MSDNNFFWYELMTKDATASELFYSEVVGWEPMKAPAPNDFYTLFNVNGWGVAGMMQMTPEMCEQAQPGWLGYIKVDDVDAFHVKIKDAGGSQLREPMDIPNVGRIGFCADPTGAVFCIMAPTGDRPPGGPPAKGTQGTPGWDELHAGDGAKAWEFYSKLFGWTKTGSMDMGPQGEYLIFTENGETPSGGMMTKMADSPHPFWNFYFNVDDINEATQRIKDNGGTVVMGPHEVPGNTWIVQGMDPQGTFFALVAMPK